MGYDVNVLIDYIFDTIAHAITTKLPDCGINHISPQIISYLEELIQHTDINYVKDDAPMYGVPLLLFACTFGLYDVVDWMLNNGADIELSCGVYSCLDASLAILTKGCISHFHLIFLSSLQRVYHLDCAPLLVDDIYQSIKENHFAEKHTHVLSHGMRSDTPLPPMEGHGFQSPSGPPCSLSYATTAPQQHTPLLTAQTIAEVMQLIASNSFIPTMFTTEHFRIFHLLLDHRHSIMWDFDLSIIHRFFQARTWDVLDWRHVGVIHRLLSEIPPSLQASYSLDITRGSYRPTSSPYSVINRFVNRPRHHDECMQAMYQADSTPISSEMPSKHDQWEAFTNQSAISSPPPLPMETMESHQPCPVYITILCVLFVYLFHHKESSPGGGDVGDTHTKLEGNPLSLAVIELVLSLGVASPPSLMIPSQYNQCQRQQVLERVVCLHSELLEFLFFCECYAQHPNKHFFYWLFNPSNTSRGGLQQPSLPRLRKLLSSGVIFSTFYPYQSPDCVHIIRLLMHHQLLRMDPHLGADLTNHPVFQSTPEKMSSYYVHPSKPLSTDSMSGGPPTGELMNFTSSFHRRPPLNTNAFHHVISSIFELPTMDIDQLLWLSPSTHHHLKPPVQSHRMRPYRIANKRQRSTQPPSDTPPIVKRSRLCYGSTPSHRPSWYYPLIMFSILMQLPLLRPTFISSLQSIVAVEITSTRRFIRRTLSTLRAWQSSKRLVSHSSFLNGSISPPRHHHCNFPTSQHQCDKQYDLLSKFPDMSIDHVANPLGIPPLRTTGQHDPCHPNTIDMIGTLQNLLSSEIVISLDEVQSIYSFLAAWVRSGLVLCSPIDNPRISPYAPISTQILRTNRLLGLSSPTPSQRPRKLAVTTQSNTAQIRNLLMLFTSLAEIIVSRAQPPANIPAFLVEAPTSQVFPYHIPLPQCSPSSPADYTSVHSHSHSYFLNPFDHPVTNHIECYLMSHVPYQHSSYSSSSSSSMTLSPVLSAEIVPLYQQLCSLMSFYNTMITFYNLPRIELFTLLFVYLIQSDVSQTSLFYCILVYLEREPVLLEAIFGLLHFSMTGAMRGGIEIDDDRALMSYLHGDDDGRNDHIAYPNLEPNDRDNHDDHDHSRHCHTITNCARLARFNHLFFFQTPSITQLSSMTVICPHLLLIQIFSRLFPSVSLPCAIWVRLHSGFSTQSSHEPYAHPLHTDNTSPTHLHNPSTLYNFILWVADHPYTVFNGIYPHDDAWKNTMTTIYLRHEDYSIVFPFESNQDVSQYCLLSSLSNQCVDILSTFLMPESPTLASYCSNHQPIHEPSPHHKSAQATQLTDLFRCFIILKYIQGLYLLLASSQYALITTPPTLCHDTPSSTTSSDYNDFPIFLSAPPPHQSEAVSLHITSHLNKLWSQYLHQVSDSPPQADLHSQFRHTPPMIHVTVFPPSTDTIQNTYVATFPMFRVFHLIVEHLGCTVNQLQRFSYASSSLLLFILSKMMNDTLTILPFSNDAPELVHTLQLPIIPHLIHFILVQLARVPRLLVSPSCQDTPNAHNDSDMHAQSPTIMADPQYQSVSSLRRYTQLKAYEHFGYPGLDTSTHLIPCIARSWQPTLDNVKHDGYCQYYICVITLFNRLYSITQSIIYTNPSLCPSSITPETHSYRTTANIRTDIDLYQTHTRHVVSEFMSRQMVASAGQGGCNIGNYCFPQLSLLTQPGLLGYCTLLPEILACLDGCTPQTQYHYVSHTTKTNNVECSVSIHHLPHITYLNYCLATYKPILHHFLAGKSAGILPIIHILMGYINGIEQRIGELIVPTARVELEKSPVFAKIIFNKDNPSGDDDEDHSPMIILSSPLKINKTLMSSYFNDVDAFLRHKSPSPTQQLGHHHSPHSENAWQDKMTSVDGASIRFYLLDECLDYILIHRHILQPQSHSSHYNDSTSSLPSSLLSSPLPSSPSITPSNYEYLEDLNDTEYLSAIDSMSSPDNDPSHDTSQHHHDTPSDPLTTPYQHLLYPFMELVLSRNMHYLPLTISTDYYGSNDLQRSYVRQFFPIDADRTLLFYLHVYFHAFLPETFAIHKFRTHLDLLSDVVHSVIEFYHDTYFSSRIRYLSHVVSHNALELFHLSIPSPQTNERGEKDNPIYDGSPHTHYTHTASVLSSLNQYLMTTIFSSPLTITKQELLNSLDNSDEVACRTFLELLRYEYYAKAFIHITLWLEQTHPNLHKFNYVAACTYLMDCTYKIHTTLYDRHIFDLLLSRFPSDTSLFNHHIFLSIFRSKTVDEQPIRSTTRRARIYRPPLVFNTIDMYILKHILSLYTVTVRLQSQQLVLTQVIDSTSSHIHINAIYLDIIYSLLSFGIHPPFYNAHSFFYPSPDSLANSYISSYFRDYLFSSIHQVYKTGIMTSYPSITSIFLDHYDIFCPKHAYDMHGILTPRIHRLIHAMGCYYKRRQFIPQLTVGYGGFITALALHPDKHLFHAIFGDECPDRIRSLYPSLSFTDFMTSPPPPPPMVSIVPVPDDTILPNKVVPPYARHIDWHRINELCTIQYTVKTRHNHSYEVVTCRGLFWYFALTVVSPSIDDLTLLFTTLTHIPHADDADGSHGNDNNQDNFHGNHHTNDIPTSIIEGDENDSGYNDDNGDSEDNSDPSITLIPMVDMITASPLMMYNTRDESVLMHAIVRRWSETALFFLVNQLGMHHVVTHRDRRQWSAYDYMLHFNIAEYAPDLFTMVSNFITDNDL